ncbi:MAG TPA: SRPBCC domain-containing protein [Ktedonobacteraceae bacterium]|nr:SRPBCC domain-containing protein [Ktedonobacteraceae bacterium]
MTAENIVVEVTYPHSIWQIWHALTDREALAAWLMPNDFEPRVGHRFTFHVAPQHGWSGIVECQVIELIAPYRVAYTWRGGQDQPETTVTFTLTPHERGTSLRLEHAGFETDDDQGFSLRDVLSSGWNAKLLREKLPAFLREEAVQGTTYE